MALMQEERTNSRWAGGNGRGMRRHISVALTCATIVFSMAAAAQATSVLLPAITRVQARTAIFKWWHRYGKYNPHIVWQRNYGLNEAEVKTRIRWGDHVDQCVHGVAWNYVDVIREGTMFRVKFLYQQIGVKINIGCALNTVNPKPPNAQSRATTALAAHGKT